MNKAMKQQLQKNDDFKKELRDLLNRYSQENGSNTPDFILADYLFDCLQCFNATSQSREKWYGRALGIAGQTLDPEDPATYNK